MPKWMTVAFTFFLCLHVFSTEAHTVDEVINNYMNAMGGREKLNSIRSIYMESIAVMPNGSHVKIRTAKIKGAFCRLEISSEKNSRVYVITDKKALVCDSRVSRKFRAVPGSAKYLRGELDCAGALVDYAAKGHKAELAGKEAVDGIECYKITVTLNSGEKVDYFIDAESWLIKRETRPNREIVAGGTSNDQENTITVDYSDYRKTPAGYVFPHVLKLGSLPANFMYKRIEINIPVEHSLPGE